MYYLAISAFDFDPYSLSGAIFRNQSTGVLGPTGVGAGEPIDDWFAVNGASPGGAYTINLTGARACDSTAPTIDLRTPPEGAVYGLGENVAADYSCADEAGGSGIKSCTGDVADGAALDTASRGTKSFTVRAEDNDGNIQTVTRFYEVVDRTKPTIDLDTPADGAVYDRGEVVLADYSCDDEPGGSGLASCEGDVADGEAIDTATAGVKTFTVTAADNDGNTQSVTHSYRVADRTKPTVDLDTPADGAVYDRGAVVLADYSCADEAGGSGLESCSGNVPDGQAIDTASAGVKSFTVTAEDNDGNTESVTHSYRVADRTKPTIDLDTPADGAVYDRGSVVNADYSCADEAGGSGLKSCVGTVPDGDAIDTSSAGVKTFTVTAEDNDGNTESVTHSYRVVDRTKPTVDLDTPADGAVYDRGSVVNADYSCADEAGGSGLKCCSARCLTATRSTRRARARRRSRSRRRTTTATRTRLPTATGSSTAPSRRSP